MTPHFSGADQVSKPPLCERSGKAFHEDGKFRVIVKRNIFTILVSLPDRARLGRSNVGNSVAPDSTGAVPCDTSSALNTIVYGGSSRVAAAETARAPIPPDRARLGPVSGTPRPRSFLQKSLAAR